MDHFDPSPKPFPGTRNAIFHRPSRALFKILNKARDGGGRGASPMSPGARILEGAGGVALLQCQDATYPLDVESGS